MAKKNMPEKNLPWIEARRRSRLSDAHIQMARELGLNLKKFGSLANTREDPWKLPLLEFIEELYLRHFKKGPPENVRSIEQIVRGANRKRGERRVRKQAQPPAADPPET